MKTNYVNNSLYWHWNIQIEQGDIATNLQEVTVPILSNSECRKSGYGERRITDNMLCAGFKDGEKDSCQVNRI